MNRTTGSTSGAGNAYCSVLQPIVCRFCHFSFGYCKKKIRTILISMKTALAF
jgi:hypothetical protein